MAKAPADQFYYADFTRDTQGLSLAACGAWMRCLCQMWFSKERGVIVMRLDAYARMFGCLTDQAKQVLDEIVELDVGDRVTLDDGRIQLTNRRMVRDQADRDADARRKREQREREAQEKNGKKDVTELSRECHTPSSSSSSTAFKEIDSYVHACVSEHADKDPRLVEIAVLETMIRRKGSANEGKAIKSIRYFDQEIHQMLKTGRTLGDKAIDALRQRRREQVSE